MDMSKYMGSPFLKVEDVGERAAPRQDREDRDRAI
jgi:hypothetical protein